MNQPRLISVMAALLALWLTACYSGSRLSPRFEGVWSPATLKQVCRTLQAESKESTILAGASIWAFESGLQPYLNIAHPTEMQRRFRSDFADSLLQQPPDFIIVDSHTQRKYNRYWDVITRELEARYERLAAWQNDDAPVTLYRLMAGERPEPENVSLQAGAVSLRSKTIGGLVWTGASKVSMHLVLFIVNILLARISDKGDFGIAGMAMLVTLAISLVNDSGLGTSGAAQRDH